MGTPVRSEAVALLAIAILHLAVQVAHGYSHVAADVPLTAFQQLFILVFVTVAPLAAVYAFWKMDRRTGAALFSLSMAAAFLFGYLLHFVIDSPDLHSKRHRPAPEPVSSFRPGLALTEFLGFFFGAYLAMSARP